MLTHRGGWWLFQRGFCMEDMQNTSTGSKKILTTFTKKQQVQFQCVLHHPPPLDLTPVGFTPSTGTPTRAADPPQRPCFEPPRLQRPSPNCISLAFGSLSLRETTGCSSRGSWFYRLRFCSFSFWWVCSRIFHLLFLRAPMLQCFLGYTELEKKATATSLGVCCAGHRRLMLLTGGCNRAPAKLALT